MKIPPYLALFSVCSGVALAQQGSSPLDTVYLQTASSAVADAHFQMALPSYTFGSASYIAAQQDVQTYHDSLNNVLDAHDQASAPQREYKRLLALATHAARAKDADERRDLFGNFLNDSRIFLRDHPDATRVWAMRAAAALQLNKSTTGTEAGMMLMRLPPPDREDPQIKKLLAMLNSQGWLAKGLPAVDNTTVAKPAK